MLPVVLAIHAHRLASTDVAIALAVGYFGGFLVDPIWFGIGGSPSLSTRARGRLISARTITGTRSVDIDGLIRVGRFTMNGRGGPVDLLLLRDREGVRLAFEESHLDVQIRQALQRSLAGPDGAAIRVSRYAARRLGLEPGSPGRRGILSAAGVLRMIAAPAGYALIGYLLARLFV